MENLTAKTAYRGVNGQEYVQLIPVKSIHIKRLEGTEWESTFPTLTAANAALFYQSYTAPQGGGYDKCAFTVILPNGGEYEGRFDLQHLSHGMPDLGRHIRQHLEYLASGHTFTAEYTALARHLLENVDFGQSPVPNTKGLPVVVDYSKEEVIK